MKTVLSPEDTELLRELCVKSRAGSRVMELFDQDPAAVLRGILEEAQKDLKHVSSMLNSTIQMGAGSILPEVKKNRAEYAAKRKAQEQAST